jgi:hypothetical protein
MKYRVVVNGVSLFTTDKQIRRGVGDFYQTNAALQKALLVLEDMRKGNSATRGLAGNWEGLNVSIDRIDASYANSVIQL